MSLETKKDLFVILFYLFAVIGLLNITGCGGVSEDYYSSMSLKEFLFETKYTLIVDGDVITQYDDKTVGCHKPTVLAIHDENNKMISEFLYKPLEIDPEVNNGWVNFPETDIQLKLFSWT